MKPDRVATGRLLGVAAVGLGLVVALWYALARLLVTDRGLDLTDEGLYLLAADPPSRSAAWVVPFGWHTRWLFSLVGHDIASFRTAAALIVVCAGATTGIAVVVHSSVSGATVEERSRWVTTCGAIAGGIASLLLFAGLLRTPGYNWVNLVGLLVATSGALTLIDLVPTAFRARSTTFLLGSAGVAAGAFMSVVAKPTSGPAVVLMALLLVATSSGPRAARITAIAVMSWGASFVAVAVLVGLWPRDFLSVFRHAMDFPVPSERQNLAAAFSDIAHFPNAMWDAFAALPTTTCIVLALAAITAIALAVIRVERPRGLRCLPLTLAAAAAVGVAVPIHGLGMPSSKGRFAWVGTSTWLWILFVGCVLHTVANGRGTDRRELRRAIAVSAFLVAAGLVFAFGSGHGSYRQSGLGAVFVALAALALLAAGKWPTRLAASALVSMVVVIGLASTLSASFEQPYRIAPVDELTAEVAAGPRSSTLFVDTSTERMLDELSRAATSAGWCAGDRLLGFVWRWSSTVPYHLGARVPDTLMVTLFGYPNSVTIADYTLAGLQRDTWRDAWILTSNPMTLTTPDQQTVTAATDLLPHHLGREFPNDYEMAAAVGDLQMWRPADAPHGSCPASAAALASTSAMMATG